MIEFVILLLINVNLFSLHKLLKAQKISVHIYLHVVAYVYTICLVVDLIHVTKNNFSIPETEIMYRRIKTTFTSAKNRDMVM